MASWSAGEVAFPTGSRWPTEGTNVAWLVLETGGAARIDDFSAATDPIGVAAREAGYRSAVGSPIVVEGRLWGLISATSTEGPLPPGTEARLEKFTELVATAIANADGKAELTASRRRIVTASDEARRRIERDLHDGVQQQLVALKFELRILRDTIEHDDELRAQVDRLLNAHDEVLDSLVELSRGIHPAILSRGGLAPALGTLARRATVPVELEVDVEQRLSEEVEVAVYFVVSEALANAGKYAQASRTDVSLVRSGDEIVVLIRDDGVGGADRTRGSGLVGLADRVEALGGSLAVRSEPGHGTSVTARLPLDLEAREGRGRGSLLVSEASSTH
jgi:signal transduction histidine kinase